MQYVHKSIPPQEAIALAGRAIEIRGEWHLIKTYLHDKEAVLILMALPREIRIRRHENGAYDPGPPLDDLIKKGWHPYE